MSNCPVSLAPHSSSSGPPQLFCHAVFCRHRTGYQHLNAGPEGGGKRNFYDDHVCHEGDLSHRFGVCLRVVYQREPRLPVQPPPSILSLGGDEVDRCLLGMEQDNGQRKHGMTGSCC